MKLNIAKIEAALNKIPEQFKDKVVQVGIPSGKFYEDGTSVAYVAAIHEYGAPEAKIPARPFFQPTIQAKKSEWVAILKQGVKQVANGSASAEDALDLVGITASKQIEETVANIYAPALSPVTVLLRKWRKDGRTITGKTVGEAAAAIRAGEDPGSDNKPLNDTGYMISQITYAVNKTGSEFVK